ncbi:phosphate:Na+ symporter [Nitratiruptor sp. YY08-26]|uniref:Na/Pi cotransporter family protein n=1 Tax=unclassified Nitratiruptor TaxID=2624044 RepID=UPI0019391467|nr:MULTISPECIES: Na/Pi symporter [unclassified Nitratiruptor]BCD63043.1 phosphate:Na+ symporter [Nitratiruptor sp. YY08-13]BCD66978.1 phosphate:Na+ symporter [Nitratiruptor sp. YY08-26]
MSYIHSWSLEIEQIKLFIEAFSGLGLFLFGMLYLEQQLRNAAGRFFKKLVRWMTSTPLKSLLAGILTTAIFQSSSVVTLMALSLIGAGLIHLQGAIGIIFGANIGTTITAWIVGIVGFKMDIKLLSYFMVGIGGLGSVLAPQESRWRNIFHAMVGFGLIFMGLEGMKESFTGFGKKISLQGLDSLWWYTLLGFGITAIIQSSSATIAIIQSALFAQIVTLEEAVTFVIGANVGTTVTAILGAIGGSSDKKRAATAHFLFNFTTGILAYLVLPLLLKITLLLIPSADPVIQIALFHTLFNLLGVILWLPFIKLLAKWLSTLFNEPKDVVTKYIHNVPSNMVDMALDASLKEIIHLCEEVEHFALFATGVPNINILEKEGSINKILEKYNEPLDVPFMTQYIHIRKIEGEILRFTHELSANATTKEVEEIIHTIAKATTYLATAAKAIKDMLLDLEQWYDGESPEEKEFLQNLRYQIIRSVQAFHYALQGNKNAKEEIEEIYKKIADSYRNTLAIISDIAKNPHIASERLTIAINDYHLSKSFTKSLRNTLTQITFMRIFLHKNGAISKKPVSEHHSRYILYHHSPSYV